ncbi:hypothetical protein HALA3H3_p50002 [Halomonas sp. A3H3]|nr:hypothetical protein HALA3H3_p50002 [Halomonas sp. A3H3]
MAALHVTTRPISPRDLHSAGMREEMDHEQEQACDRRHSGSTHPGPEGRHRPLAETLEAR